MNWYRTVFLDIFSDDSGYDHEVEANRAVAYFETKSCEDAFLSAQYVWKTHFTKLGEHHYRQAWRLGETQQREISDVCVKLLRGRKHEDRLIPVGCSQCSRVTWFEREPKDLVELLSELEDKPALRLQLHSQNHRLTTKIAALEETLNRPRLFSDGKYYFLFFI